ncbi:hypothetical protein ACIOHR_37610 [Streptomyces anulatus]
MATLKTLSDPALSAVVVAEAGSPAWLGALDALVVTRRLVIPRTTLTSATPDDVARWAHTTLAGVPASVAGPLLDDMTAIAAWVAEQSRTGRVLVRIFTETPTRRCGFHVDTVPPRASPIGALRVYNGRTTEYVIPGDVRSMPDFYAYLSCRERLAKGTVAPRSDRTAELLALDESPAFLRQGARIHSVPPGATVYFKHIDVTRHWSAHPVGDVWIQRSPSSGGPRLVLNVSPTTAVPAAPGRERTAGA